MFCTLVFDCKFIEVVLQLTFFLLFCEKMAGQVVQGIDTLLSAMKGNIIPDQEYLLQGSLLDSHIEVFKHRLLSRERKYHSRSRISFTRKSFGQSYRSFQTQITRPLWQYFRYIAQYFIVNSILFLNRKILKHRVILDGKGYICKSKTCHLKDSSTYP